LTSLPPSPPPPNAVLSDTHRPIVHVFNGRLLTMAQLPNDLQVGQSLRVRAKTIVTPEVRDQLKTWGVRLEKWNENTTPEPTRSQDRALAGTKVDHATPSAALQVWWHRAAGRPRAMPEPQRAWPWLGKLDPRLATEVQGMDCGRQLAAAVALAVSQPGPRGRGPTQLVLSERPWEVQRHLATEHRLFAWCLTGVGPLSWEQVREAAPAVLLSSPPLTSWLVRRWLALVPYKST